MEHKVILRNALRTPDGTVIESKYRHDYVTHQDTNGETYVVDGGHDYLRRSVNSQPYEPLDVYLSDDHESNRTWFKWTSYGADGQGPAKTQSLKDMDTDHIQAILDNGYARSDWGKDLLQTELEYRRRSP